MCRPTAVGVVGSPRVWEVAVSFAELLREHRRGLGLTQEELAERAQLSARAISDLERGLKQSPRPTTVRLLARALGLSEADASQFLRVAQGRQRQFVAGQAAPNSPMQPTSATELPSGTVTFLFTDLEGHTRLWEADPEAMRASLARHDAILREAVRAHHGHVVKATGDGLHAAFARATDALGAAIDAQLALAAESWPLPGPLCARMGLHTGTTEERDGDYFGLPVNRAARVMQAAHGGQVLLSLVTAQLVRGELPSGTSLRDLGEHLLKDMREPERLFQVVAPDLPDGFPPVHSQDTRLADSPRSSNLPLQLTSFVGRESQVSALRDLVGTARLVTVTGPAGIGKTRLALRVAAEVCPSFVDGVRFVDLSAVRDADLVSHHLAALFNVREQSGEPVVNRLVEALGRRQLVMVVDNCEHLLDACAAVIHALLLGCPGTHVLATSREPLGVEGEVVWRVPPLSLTATFEESEAARLFEQRAQLAQPGFRLTSKNAAAVTEICEKLEGIPLALELAAARLSGLALEDIAAHLHTQLKLLSAGQRTAPVRQRSLRAAIDWSYDLLSPRERCLFRQLAVFSGGWTLPAAREVCASACLSAEDVIEVLASLTEKSLVTLDSTADGAPRYRLLEALREYAEERLAEERDGAFARRRHAEFYLGLAERALGVAERPFDASSMKQVEAEHDNLLAALGWSADGGDAELGVKLVRLLSRFWPVRGHLHVATRWIGWALENAPPATQTWAELLDRAGMIALLRGDLARGRNYLEHSVAALREVGDVDGAARGLLRLGQFHAQAGELVRAQEYFQQGLTSFRTTGSRRGMAFALAVQGQLAFFRGDARAARALLEESLRIYEELGNQRGQSAELAELALVALDTGDAQTARDHLRTALRLSTELGYTDVIAEALLGYGWLAEYESAPARALQLAGAADALRRTAGMVQDALDGAAHQRWQDRCGRALGRDAAAAAYAAGNVMSVDEALSLAALVAETHPASYQTRARVISSSRSAESDRSG